MFFLGKKPQTAAPATAAQLRGRAGEDRALAHLQARGLHLLVRNYQAPGRAGGEIDLILQDTQGTVVFVEVRSRSRADFGGAGAASVRPSASAWWRRPSIGCSGTGPRAPAASMWC